MSKIAIFPGSFDPFTNGHYEIVRRAFPLFDELIIAVGYNSTKDSRYFPVQLIIEKIEYVFRKNSSIRVIMYNELTANIAKKNNAKYIIRGLRNTTDFEYENTIAQINQSIFEKLETIFLITSPQYAPISSTIIREVHRYNGDISKFIPYDL